MFERLDIKKMRIEGYPPATSAIPLLRITNDKFTSSKSSVSSCSSSLKSNFEDHGNRADTLAALLDFYEAVGLKYGRGHWNLLVAVPGWKEKLANLEQTFLASWEQGRACLDEFGQLKDHWRDGFKAISSNGGAI